MKDFSWVDVQYPKKLRELHNDLEFLPERMKIEKIEKLVTNLHEKTEYAIHIRNLKQALNHGLILKKVHSYQGMFYAFHACNSCTHESALFKNCKRFWCFTCIF